MRTMERWFLEPGMKQAVKDLSHDELSLREGDYNGPVFLRNGQPKRPLRHYMKA